MTDDYSTIQVKEIPCPFCKDGIVKAHHRPSVRSFRTSRSAAGAKSVPCRTTEKWNVLSGCSKCGKTKQEIVKALKEGVSPSKEDIIKRAKEAGLPLRF